MYHDYNIVRPAHMPEWMKKGLEQQRRVRNKTIAKLLKQRLSKGHYTK